MIVSDGWRWARQNPVAVFVLILGAVLRLSWLTRQSLWSDEASTLIIAQAPQRAMTLLRSLEGMPPLHPLLMRLWLKFWPDPLLGMRAFSALCGIATLPVYWSLCRRLLARQAPLAFFLGGCSSLWIHAAQTGRPYSLFLLLAVVQVHLAWDLRSSWSGRAALCYALVALCGVYVHYYYHFLLFALALSLLCESEFRRRCLGPWLALHAAVWLAFLPWLPTVLVQRQAFSNSLFLRETLFNGGLSLVFGSFLCDAGYLGLAAPNWVRALGYATGALTAVGLWRLRRRLTQEEDAAARFCIINLLLPLAMVAILESHNGQPACQPRYFIFLPVLFYPLLALAAQRGLPWAWERGINLSLSGIAACGVCLYLASNIIIDPHLAALSALIRRHGDRREPIVYLNEIDYDAMRSYYLPERAHFLIDWNGAWKESSATSAVDPRLITPHILSVLPRCLVMDPQRRFVPQRLGLCSGAQLVALAGPPATEAGSQAAAVRQPRSPAGQRTPPLH
jgi:hypothetical protein